jgi:thiamine biosynthesis protein ThiI
MESCKEVIIARYGEIHLKGTNRGFFLRVLERNIKDKLKGIAANVRLEDTRVVITDFDNKKDSGEITDRLQTVFGLTSISFGEQLHYKTPDDILRCLSKYKIDGLFKVEVNRADKSFPVKSPAFAAAAGETLLRNNKNAKVDVTSPDITILVDIRAKGIVYIFNERCRNNGIGGLPVGVSGRALCLISGGIDSPVAAFMAAKRGMTADFVHFASPPYTGDRALEKVKMLCKIICKYCGDANLFIVPFTEIQREIREHCREEFMITIMRRFMVALAEKVGLENRADCLVTGENLAQVASQTIEGITTNNFVATKLPILRPLICFDKNEIITSAKRIGTYETSILPYADCCTVFVPKHPAIKPKLEEVERECKRLPYAKLVDKAYSEVCKLQITCGGL